MMCLKMLVKLLNPSIRSGRNIGVGGGLVFAQISAGPSSEKWQQVAGIYSFKDIGRLRSTIRRLHVRVVCQSLVGEFSRLGRLDWPADGEVECYSGNHDEALNVTHLD
jgi:hypothetical protein